MADKIKPRDIVDDITQYLDSRQAVPDIAFEFPKTGGVAEFVYPNARLPTGKIRLGPDAGEGALAHEMTHAAENQISNQYYELLKIATDAPWKTLLDKYQGNNPLDFQFRDAFEKMRKHDTMFDSLKKMEPDWWKTVSKYRTSREEVPAFGVGNATQPTDAVTKAPSHIDATAATEFAIMLDLALRQAVLSPKQSASTPSAQKSSAPPSQWTPFFKRMDEIMSLLPK